MKSLQTLGIRNILDLFRGTVIVPLPDPYKD